MQDPPRIACFFATSGHSGVDRIMQRLLPAIAARGYAVDLLKLAGHGPEISPASNLEVIELGAAHVLSAVPALSRYLRRAAPAVLFSDKDRVNRAAWVAHRLARSRARLVFRNGTTVSMDLRRRKPLDRLMQGLSMRLLYGRPDAIVMPSRGAAEDFARLARLDVDRIRVVPSPVVSPDLDAAASEPITHPWFAEKTLPVIVSAGELCDRKDFETLLRGFALLSARTAARLVILGRGKRRERLLALAGEIGVAADVDLPGFVPNPYPYLARADLFALTSRWEGMPVVLIEALAVGTPVVATDCPSGPREILADGRIGALVPVGDPSALSAAMAATLAARPDPALLKSAAAPYSIAASTDAYLAAMGLEPRP